MFVENLFAEGETESVRDMPVYDRMIGEHVITAAILNVASTSRKS